MIDEGEEWRGWEEMWKRREVEGEINKLNAELSNKRYMIYNALRIILNIRICPWISQYPQSHLDAPRSCPCVVW